MQVIWADALNNISAWRKFCCPHLWLYVFGFFCVSVTLSVYSCIIIRWYVMYVYCLIWSQIGHCFPDFFSQGFLSLVYNPGFSKCIMSINFVLVFFFFFFFFFFFSFLITWGTGWIAIVQNEIICLERKCQRFLYILCTTVSDNPHIKKRKKKKKEKENVIVVKWTRFWNIILFGVCFDMIIVLCV